VTDPPYFALFVDIAPIVIPAASVCAYRGKEVTTMTKMIRRMVAGLGVAMTLVAGMQTDAMAQTLSRVGALCTDTWTSYASRGQMVRVLVNGDGDTDLDVYVYQDGQLVGYDADDTDYCLVVFRAPRSGRFQVRVVNRGRVWNQYEISID
jgi:hypothetical protein